MEPENTTIDNNEFVENNIIWTKLAETKSFDSELQQTFKVKRDSFLVIKIDDKYFILN